MKVTGFDYDYLIEPTPFGSLRAEIYKTHKGIEVLVTSKTFYGVFRSLRKKDYVNAKKWVREQLRQIKDINSEVIY